jgi:hypothetical protein
MSDLVSRVIRELPDTDRDRYDVAYERGRAQARSTKILAGLVTGLTAGVAGMFFLDPERGRSRRAEFGQRLTGLTNDLARTSAGRAKDLRNRAQGFAAEHDLPGSPAGKEQEHESADITGVTVMDIPADTAQELRRTDAPVAAGTIADPDARRR